LHALLVIGATLLGALVLTAPGAAAQDPGGVEANESAGEIPVTLGRPGNVFPDNGWFDGGPAVPLMALATMGMLAAGAWIIASRCRRSPAAD
jgi:hypothetical protein